jgi:uncharacterized protein
MAPIRLVTAAVVVSTAVVVSFVVSTWVASRAYLQRGEQGERLSRTLEVAGSAKLRIQSDLALWSIVVAGEAKTLEEAFKKLEEGAVQVRSFLGQKGLGESAKPGPIRTVTHHARDAKGSETREVASYRLSRVFEVKTSEVALVERASGEITELLKAGVHVESLAPEFIPTKLQELKARMVGEATANARQRADLIARESGCRVTSVKDARAGVLQITKPWSTEVSAGGMSDTSSVEKDVTAVVHLTLLVAPR